MSTHYVYCVSRYKYQRFDIYSPVTHVPRGGYHVLGAMHVTVAAPRRSGKFLVMQKYETVASNRHWEFCAQFPFAKLTPFCSFWIAQVISEMGFRVRMDLSFTYPLNECNGFVRLCSTWWPTCKPSSFNPYSLLLVMLADYACTQLKYTLSNELCFISAILVHD